MNRVCQEVTNRIASKCKVLVIAFSGSQAYNLATSSSDQDLVAVYVVPLRSYLSLQKTYIETSFGSFQVENKHDYTIREVGAFANLLLESNPNIIEWLYFTNLLVHSEEWGELCSKRNCFLTRKFLSKYVGHAVSAMRPDNKGIYSSKGISHALRVLCEADRMIQKNLTTNEIGGPIVYLHEDRVEEENKISLNEQHKEILRVKALDEATNQTELKTLASSLKTKVKLLDSLIEKTTFPIEVANEHVDWLNDWLYRLRVSYME